MTDSLELRTSPDLGGLAVFVAVDESVGAPERADVARLLDRVVDSLAKIRGVAATSIMLMSESSASALQSASAASATPANARSASDPATDSATPDAADSPPRRLGVLIDLARHRVIVDGCAVTLRYRELALLRHLALNQGVVHSRAELVAVLELPAEADRLKPRTIDAYLQRVRKGIHPYGDAIQTIRGQGYRFDRHPDITVIRPDAAPAPSSR